MSDYIISVRLMTYNHEAYIEQALESVFMQETSFKVELVIGDDFSTDKTLEKIKRFKSTPNIHLKVLDRKKGDAYWQERQKRGRLYNFLDIVNHCSGKYVAMLDGDDYWTDPNKLQKQVDFLEQHSEYGMVHTWHEIYIQDKQKFLNREISQSRYKKLDDLTFEDILLENPISTLTTVTRKALLLNAWHSFPQDNTWLMGDYPIWLYVAQHAKIKFLPDSTAVYRVLKHSMSNVHSFQRKMDFLNSTYGVKDWFIEKYGCTEQTKAEINRRYQKEKLRAAFVYQKPKAAKAAVSELKKLKAYTGKDRMFLFGSKNKLAEGIIRAGLKVFFPRMDL